MCLQKMLLKSLAVLFLITSSLIANPEDFKEEAKQVFPSQPNPYTYEDLKKKFSPILKREIKDEFLKGLNILFHPEFPNPTHPNEVIINGYRCLYRKVKDANTIKEEKEEQFPLQLHALYQLLSLHKKTIERLDAHLLNRISKFLPCENCVNTAKGELLGPE
ncbi:MAG: hypothetical protein BGO77_04895 [Caedibacter sp. 37-49]|nr:MAG: hypothetical protein BGO77_04895 [Caedibacter sp. 37-49]